MTTTMKPTMYGVGINNVPGSWGKKYYKLWEDIHQRCYSDNYHSYFPAYKGCTVDPRWQYLDQFKKWFEQQSYKPGMHLDKDLIKPGNKVYGPDTSLFVPHELNIFFSIKKNKKNNLPPGVSKIHNGKYRAYCKDFNKKGRVVHLGLYNTPMEAFEAYRTHKKQTFYNIFILDEKYAEYRNILTNVYINFNLYVTP